MQKSVMGTVKETSQRQQSPGRAQEPQESPTQQKQDFKTVSQQHEDMVQGRRKPAAEMIKNAVESKTDEMVNKANAALSGMGNGPDFDEFEQLQKISDEDLELAEQVIFKGYAEKVVTIPNMPGHTFTITTTSAEDMSVIDEIIYDMVKDKEDKDGQVDLPAQHVQTFRSALMIAIGFKGMDGKDYCDEPIHQLMAIKRAVIKVKDLEYEGDIEKSAKLSESLKRSLKHRAVRVRRLPTPVIDFISNEKIMFDQAMYQIMTAKQLIPKSSGQSRDTQEPASPMKENDSSTDQ